jgi:hypothetical protein
LSRCLTVSASLIQPLIAGYRRGQIWRWFKDAPMADSTRAMRRVIFEREQLPVFRNRLQLNSFVPADVGKILGLPASMTAPQMINQGRRP